MIGSAWARARFDYPAMMNTLGRCVRIAWGAIMPFWGCEKGNWSCLMRMRAHTDIRVRSINSKAENSYKSWFYDEAGFIGDGSSGRLSWLRMKRRATTHTHTHTPRPLNDGMENAFPIFPLFCPQFLRLEKFPSDDSSSLTFFLPLGRYMHERSDGVSGGFWFITP